MYLYAGVCAGVGECAVVCESVGCMCTDVKLFVLYKETKESMRQGTTYLQTTQANPISMAKSSALVSSKLERSAMAKSLLVWTVMGEDRVSGFSSLGFFGTSTPSVMSDFIYKKHPIKK